MRMEMKKVFSSWLTFLCLGVTLACIGVFFAASAQNRDVLSGAYEELLAEYRAEYSEEEICGRLSGEKDRLWEETDAAGESAYTQKGKYADSLYGDFLLFNRAYETADYIYRRLPEGRRNLVKDSLSHITEESQKKHPDESVIRENETIIAKYNRVIPCELKSTGDLESMSAGFDHTYWDFLMIAFTAMLAVRMFTMDASSGAYRMLYSSVKGRKSLFLRQFAAVSAVVCAVAAVQSFCQMVCGALFFSVRDYSLPIQMAEEFEYCPYLLNVGEYFLIKFLMKLLFYLLMVSVSVLIAVLCRKPLPSLLWALVFGIGPLILMFGLYDYSASENVDPFGSTYRLFQLLRCVLPQSLLNIRTYFQNYDMIYFGGLPVGRLIPACLTTAAASAACFIVSLLRFGQPQKR